MPGSDTPKRNGFVRRPWPAGGLCASSVVPPNHDCRQRHQDKHGEGPDKGGYRRTKNEYGHEADLDNRRVKAGHANGRSHVCLLNNHLSLLGIWLL